MSVGNPFLPNQTGRKPISINKLESLTMKLKTVTVDGKEYAEVRDGKPIYVHQDGKEIDFDAPAAMSKITALNGEAKGHRERAEAAEAKVKAFDGIEDAEAARKAVETVKNLDEGKLITAGKVDEIKSSAKRAAEESVEAARKAHAQELEQARAERDKYRGQLHSEKIGNAFARSKFIQDKIAVPVDLMQAMFGGKFSVEDDGRLVAKQDGTALASRTKFGEPAEFDEAIELLVGEYPHRDAILKGAGSSGTGAKPANGAGAGGKTMTRTEFESLSQADRHAKFKDGFKVVEA